MYYFISEPVSVGLANEMIIIKIGCRKTKYYAR